MKILDFDIEADGYLRDATIVWCCVGRLSDTQEWIVYHVDTEEEVHYPKNSRRVSLEEFLGYFEEYTPSAYNSLGYDLPLLNKLHGFSYDVNKVIDPLIMSRLSFPDREGHSIKDWGEKFRLYKGEHNDFSKFSNEMLQYCFQDTRILIKAREFLEKEMSDWDWSESLKLEKNIQFVQTKQELHGVLFDKQKAEELLGKIESEVKDLETTIISEIPMHYKDEGEVRKVFNKDGSYTLSVKNWLGKEEECTNVVSY